ncbi:MAG: lamin tail domain-containing protein [Verrucomicrobiaceae bacterium]|nr:lamin tail domain-containing protein [Verrucomicrobiaceae bacterium]
MTHRYPLPARLPKSPGIIALSLILSLFAFSSPAFAAPILRITEVMSNGDTSDWFELTNYGDAAASITGYQMDDNSFANVSTSVALQGVTSIAPGESVVFIESAAGAGVAAFKTNWSLGSSVQVGYYSGTGVGLSSAGDGVTVFSNTSAKGGTELAGPFGGLIRVTFGAATTGTTYRWTYDATGASTSSATGVLTTTGTTWLNGATNMLGTPGAAIPPATPVVTITATDASAAEAFVPDTGAFRISRAGSTTSALTVNYTITTGTGRAAATDYTPALSGTAVINAGESFTDITITPVDDLLLEGDETAELTITDTVDYDLGANVTASVSITDNDVSVNLANYVRVGRYDLPEPTRTSLPPGIPTSNLLCQEASAVTYNWDTDSLFITGDGGRSITQVSKTGALIDTMTLALGSSPQGTDFYDPEGLTYIGGGQFVMSEERDRQLVKFTYAAGTTLSRTSPGVQTVKIGTFVDNVGTEGLSWDPQTGGFIVLKEITPMGIFHTGVDFNAGTATNGSPTTVNSTNLFDPALLGMTDTADVYALSNLTALNGQTQSGNLIVLSQENARVINVDRSGNIHSTLTIQSDVGNPLTPAGQQHEGITMDRVGNIYIVNENGGGSIDYPQLWVYSPSAMPNQPATAVAVSNGVTSIMENTSTAARIKVGDVVVTDDGLGTNTLSINGADAASFELTGTELFLKAGVVLDYETKTSYTISIHADDTTVGGTPDASVAFTLNVQDQVVETPPAAVLVITEVAPWSSSNSPGVLADWFELTNVSSNAVTLTGYKMDDNSFTFGSAVALNGITTIAPGESVIFIETSDLPGKTTAFINTWFGGTAPSGLQIGNYTGSGVGLSSGGDGVIIFNAAGTEQCRVSFGASTGPVYRTFDNTLAQNNVTVSLLSQAGVNGAFVAPANASEVGSPGYSAPPVLRITEVAPWGSGSSPYLADWFEVTNIGGRSIDMTGWKIDDSSESPAAAAALTGIASIAPGESVIYLETATPTTTINSFRSTWFGASPPSGLQIGSYTGSGIGLSTGGDAVNLFDSNNVRRAKVFFGASTVAAPFKTFDNSAAAENALLTQFSEIGYNGAFASVNDANGIGSPGTMTIATPINGWRQTYFGSNANSGNAANTADFDGDGVSNLLEYALGANPASINGDDGIGALPEGISGNASDQPLLQDRLYLSFSIPQTAPADVTYTVQASDSLGTWTDVARKTGTGAWTWLAGGSIRIYTSVQAPYEVVQIGDSNPRDNANTRRFMRLQVSAP